MASRVGFALSATVAGDRGAALAAPGLRAELAPVLCGLPAELAALDKHARRERTARMIREVAGATSLEGGAALDAARLRPGFRASDALRRLLTRVGAPR